MDSTEPRNEWSDVNDLAAFTTPLRVPGSDGMLALVDASGSVPVQITARASQVEIMPGRHTTMLVYEVHQDGHVITNPIFKIRQGDIFAADLLNAMDESTTIHWHGFHIPWQMDGHPLYPVAPGATYLYEFAVQNRGGTYWYHPHAHGSTARQTYLGLTGMFLIEDDAQRALCEALDLTWGETDLPLLLQDKTFGAGGSLTYHPDPMVAAMGLEGDTILTNLTVNPYLEVGTRLYHFRVLNGANARMFRLAFVAHPSSEQLPYWVIAADGNLLEQPYEVTEVFLSPGERIDLLLDLTQRAVGDVVALTSLAFDPMHHEMDHETHEVTGASEDEHDMMGMGHNATAHTMDHTMEMGMHGGMEMHALQAATLASGAECRILKLVVNNDVPYDRTIPMTLSSMPSLDTRGAMIRPITLSRVIDRSAHGSLLQWLINGLTYQIDADPIVVQRNTTEIWEIRNNEQSMPHAMHLHGFHFQVLDRTDSPAQVRNQAVDGHGRVVTDLGWKDTVLVWPGETVRIAVHFAHAFDGEQRYVFHCHMLEHEDAGMMLNYLVVDAKHP